ncbi:hypothetical protein COCCADRAFT_87259, partial [Bipolaris zeicola 26-R-13]
HAILASSPSSNGTVATVPLADVCTLEYPRQNPKAFCYSFKNVPSRHQYLHRYAKRYCPLIHAKAEFHAPGEAAQWSVGYGVLIHPWQESASCSYCSRQYMCNSL